MAMEKLFLQKFLTWAEKYGDPKVGEPTNNPAAWIDFETDAVMARINYWSSGYCDAEIIDFDTELMLYQRHWDKLLPDQLDHELLAFFGVLKNPRHVSENFRFGKVSIREGVRVTPTAKKWL